MGPRTLAVVGLICLLALPVTGCKKSTPPMPQSVTTSPPAAGASALEVERYQLEEEKKKLSEKYSDNFARIQQINARLIEINLELQQGGQRNF